ncbi:hypothetical protein C5Y96_08065 [Blastopirellula marina]|uniref:Uncharacterized protein n=1 Tax=Blastopirellula marina TaxID=124 RepID=A0A2S8FYZ5_9BACT|nr:MULTISPECIES: hypothetical protein [Pirellulaceae]PQO37104.1 hypothetical protein C5Y96_08065 [Blastopirellula marina]RCS53819.1 hypothetical protein DTL36_08075 [Bremerella cremea]
MNDAPPVTSRWKWPTAWQWLVIVWVVALNASPYAVGLWAAGDFGSIDWMIWSMLSGPFAHTGMLTFFLLAGGLPAFVRRLTFVTGMLAILAMLMLILDDQSVGTISWFLLEAATLSALMLASAWLFGVPPKPQRWSPQFSLAEILALTVLLGIFLWMLRLAEATSLDYWEQAQEIAFITYAIGCGIYLLPIGLATIMRGRKGLTAMIVVSLLLWTIFACVILGVLMLFERTLPLEEGAYLIIIYPASAIQLLLVWGTFFPLRVCFAGVLIVAPTPPVTAAQCKSDTLAASPENCRHSEHTDVPR